MDYKVKKIVLKYHMVNLIGAILADSPNPKMQAFRGVMELIELSTIYLNYSNILLRVRTWFCIFDDYLGNSFKEC